MPDRYSRIGAFPQIFLLLLLIAGLAVGGAFWFDYLGLMDMPGIIRSGLDLVGFRQAEPVQEPGDVMLLDQLRLEKEREAIELRSSQLDERENQLAQLELDLEERLQELESREQELTERENSLNQRLERYENRRAVLEQNVRDLTSMRPEAAVEILQKYDDQLLIDTLRVTEELAQAAGEVSLVSVWLAQLDAERAADIQRKMTVKPAD